VLAKEVWESTQKLAILKHFRTHFEAKHEKGVGTPFPCVLATAHGLKPCITAVHLN